MEKQTKYPVWIAIVTVAVLCLFMPPPVSENMVILASVRHEDGNNGHVNVFSSSPAAESQRYIHRGDWEIPDILVMVENEEWQKSLDIISSASDQDGIPAYVLTNHMDEQMEQVRTTPDKKGRTRMLPSSYDSPWIRDYGPVQLKTVGNSVKWLDFSYAEDRPRDDSVPQQLASYMKQPIDNTDYYLEGGAVISNGTGLCAITDDSLDKALIDRDDSGEMASFRQALGCSVLAVLPALTGESTGHADIIAQFYSPELVAVSSIDPDIAYEVSSDLDEAADLLLSAARSVPQRLRVIRIPMYVDGPDYYSYVNGTRLRKTYLVPSFENVPDGLEDEAFKTIRSELNGVKLVPVPADAMVQSGGAVHCITLGLGLSRHHAASPFTVRRNSLDMLHNLFGFMRKTFQQEF